MSSRLTLLYYFFSTLGLLFNYFLVAYYVPRFEGAAPRWIYLSSAFAIGTASYFPHLPHDTTHRCNSLSMPHHAHTKIEWYCLLDNLDGRQARRTNNSSPLGELFDHGCDSLAVAVLNFLSTIRTPLTCCRLSFFFSRARAIYLSIRSGRALQHVSTNLGQGRRPL